MQISVSNKASRPLYEQIVTQIKAQIMSGELQAGEALPSIRSLAKSLHIRNVSRNILQRPSRLPAKAASILII